MLQALPMAVRPWLTGIPTGYSVLTLAMKQVDIRRLD